MSIRPLALVRFATLALWLLLSGCATQLAPAYDRAVVDGLNATAVETMTLLASVSAGTTAASFPVREERYNQLIGRLEALALLAGARPVPKNKVTDAINAKLAERGSPPLDDDGSTPPSVHAIKKIAETVTKLRDTDRKQGVTAFEAMAFKGQIAIYLDQAITYENFLQR
ncbi:MAG TPA: hypothetical protein VLC08_10265 [Chitinolyticbacter sp.]|nr:hypothetical protein [Chitinolyticbacter sp.]